MEFTTHLVLQSQTTRLVESRSYASNDKYERGYHPPRRSFPEDFTHHHRLTILLQTTIPKIFSLSFSRFTRSYWGNPGQFLFLRLVICLNSAGILDWLEVLIENNRWSTQLNVLLSRRVMISSRVLSALHWIGSVIRLCFHLHALSRKAVGGIQHRSGLREWGMVGMNRHSNRHTPRRKCKMRSKFWWLTDFAIRMTYRISLRSSSVWEPRHPLLKVFWHCSLARVLVDRSR